MANITEKDIMAYLQSLDGNGGGDVDLSGAMEKVASAEEVLQENDLSLADLDDDETLEVLAEAGLDEDEILGLIEALVAEGEDEDFDKEAAAEHAYTMGFSYGKGFNDAMAEGMEKTGGAVTAAKQLLAEARGTKRTARRVSGIGKRAAFMKQLRGILSGSPGAAEAGSSLRVRALRRALLTEKGAGTKISKVKAGMGIGALLAGGGGAGYMATRKRK